MGNRAGGRRTGPKCIAIVGPFASGKTTLLEAILARTGAIPRQNPVSSGNTVGDHSAEARAHAMSVEATFATTEFMGEQITFVDCPGSVEFAFESDAGARRLRHGRGGRRGRREEDPGPAAHHAQARRSRRSARAFPQQDRQDGGRRARHAEAAAAGERGAAAAAPDPAAQGRRRRSARSIWRWSAPTSGASLPRAR